LGNQIICKLHGDDVPEINNGIKGTIYINEPLRGKLGVKNNDNLELKIKKVTNLLAWFYFIRYHPDDIVKTSTWLAIIAILITVILGSISLTVTFMKQN
jgi:hypothetical protein